MPTPTPQKVERKVRKVKAWAVVNYDCKLAQGEILEQDGDCPCRSCTFMAIGIFYGKDIAKMFSDSTQKVVPCTITYSLPIKK